MSIHERAQHYLAQGQTVRAAGLMIKLVEREPTPQNLELLADIYLRQGLLDHAKVLYLQVVEAGLKESPPCASKC